MKTIYTLFAIVLPLVLAGCAADHADITPDGAGERGLCEYEGVTGSKPMPEYYGTATRATLAFNVVTSKLEFKWEKNDQVGVFAVKTDGNVPARSQTAFVVNELVSDLNVKFRILDDNFQITANKKYHSYSPYRQHDGNNILPVEYTGQKQTESPDINAYYNWQVDKNAEDAETNLTNYSNSEAAASAHLSAYDYLVSSAVSPRDNVLHLQFVRLNAIVRFFLKVPEAVIYDSMQVVNKDADFIVAADIDITKQKSNFDATTDPDYTFSNIRTSHIVSLEFNHKDNVEGKHGLDLTNENSNYYIQAKNPKPGYIIAYMMFAPINLKSDDISNSTLYLIGHDSHGNKKYYRATTQLAKLAIGQNKFLQWTYTQTFNENPIEFEPVEMQTWKDDTTFSNDGGGTEGW